MSTGTPQSKNVSKPISIGPRAAVRRKSLRGEGIISPGSSPNKAVSYVPVIHTPAQSDGDSNDVDTMEDALGYVFFEATSNPKQTMNT